MTYQRIMIIGSPGSGKSTLAAKLAQEIGLPLIHLDKLNWLDDKETVSEAVLMDRLEQAVAGKSWIIDGNYGSSMATRLKRAELVIWLQVPRRICLYRIIKRYLRSIFQENPAGNPKRLDWEFVRFVRNFPQSECATEELLESFPELRVLKVKKVDDIWDSLREKA